MNISDFENDIDPKIVARGVQYHEDGRVAAIEVDGSDYCAIVHGTDDYRVRVALDDDEIVDYDCDCPYDLGPVCKHVVALLFAVRDYIEDEQSGTAQEQPLRPVKRIQSGTDAATSLQAKLARLPREKLVSMLNSISGFSNAIGLLVGLYASEGSEKLDIAKKLIHLYVREARTGGFIESGRMGIAMQGYGIVLDEAVVCDDPAAGIELCLAALGDLSQLDDFDDSDGDWMMVWSHGTDVMGDILESRLGAMSAKDRESLFMSMQKQIRKFAVFDINMTGGEAVELLSRFSDEPACRTRYRNLLDDLYDAADAEDYHRRTLDLMIYHDLQKHGTVSDADRYLQEHLDNPEFRDLAIESALAGKRYEAALALVEDGRRRDAKFPGLVFRWDQKEYAILRATGNSAMALELARRFVLSGKPAFYDEFIELLPDAGRDEEIERLLDDLEKSESGRDLFIKILIRTGRMERMMLLCEVHPEYIVGLHTHLLITHRERAMRCFVGFIAGDAKSASKRTQYRRVVRYVKMFRTAFGAAWIPLVEQLKRSFATRPAMLDELKSL